MDGARFFLDLLLRDREFGGMTPAFVCGNEPTGLFEQTIHLLERNALGLRQKCPEKDSIGDIANDKEEKIPPAL
jgi:hypothetical protein